MKARSVMHEAIVVLRNRFDWHVLTILYQLMMILKYTVAFIDYFIRTQLLLNI